MRNRVPGALGVAIALVVLGLSWSAGPAGATNYVTSVTCTNLNGLCSAGAPTPTPGTNASVSAVGFGAGAPQNAQVFQATPNSGAAITGVVAHFSDGGTENRQPAQDGTYVFDNLTDTHFVTKLEIQWNDNAVTTTTSTTVAGATTTTTSSTTSTSTTTTTTTAPPHRGPGNGPAAIRSESVAKEGSSPDAAAVRGFNRLDVVVVDGDGNVQWTREDHPFTNWTPWTNLGKPSSGAIKGNPSITSWGPGRLDVFARGTDDKLWQRFSNDAGANWSDWLKPFGDDGTLASSPEVATRGSDRLNVFVVGTDGSIWERFYDGAWNSGWNFQGAPAGGISGTATAKSDPGTVAWGSSERVDLFVRGSDDKLWQKFYDGVGWTSWFKPVGDQGTLGSEPDVTSWEPGNLLVFIRGTNGLAYALPFGGGGWGPWVQLVLSTDGFTSGPGATSRGLDRFDAFYLKADEKTYHIWQ